MTEPTEITEEMIRGIMAQITGPPWRLVREGRGRLLLKPDRPEGLGTQIAQLFSYQANHSENAANGALLTLAPEIVWFLLNRPIEGEAFEEAATERGAEAFNAGFQACERLAGSAVLTVEELASKLADIIRRGGGFHSELYEAFESLMDELEDDDEDPVEQLQRILRRKLGDVAITATLTTKPKPYNPPVPGKIVAGPDSEIRDLNGVAGELINPRQVRLTEARGLYSIGDVIDIKLEEFEYVVELETLIAEALKYGREDTAEKLRIIGEGTVRFVQSEAPINILPDRESMDLDKVDPDLRPIAEQIAKRDAEAELVKPTVHMNGTSRESLLEDFGKGYRAINQALSICQSIGPNARDYYVQEPGAFEHARDQHRERLKKLEAIRDEYLELHTATEEKS